jgi:hypothetical protein
MKGEEEGKKFFDRDPRQGDCGTWPTWIRRLRSGDPFLFRCRFVDKELWDRIKHFKHVICQFGQRV